MTSATRVEDGRAEEFARRLRTGRHFPDTQRHAVEEMVRARASEAALSERAVALTAQNAYLRQTLEDVREWAGPKHIMVFDDGDVAVSDYVQAALDFKGVELPSKTRFEP